MSNANHPINFHSANDIRMRVHYCVWAIVYDCLENFDYIAPATNTKWNQRLNALQAFINRSVYDNELNEELMNMFEVANSCIDYIISLEY